MARYATATKKHAPQPAHSATALAGGRPLHTHTRAKMDARFGHDFSSVRIHSDNAAACFAQSAGANALTLGNHILFGSGRYSPGRRDSERLLSHELAHVVQQERSGPGDPTRSSHHDDPSEREAKKAEGLVAAGASVQISAAPDAAIARDPDGSDEGGFPGPPEYVRPYANSIMNNSAGSSTTDAPTTGAGSSPDDDTSLLDRVAGSPWVNNPYWNAITNNSVSYGTAIAEDRATEVAKIAKAKQEAEAAQKATEQANYVKSISETAQGASDTAQGADKADFFRQYHEAGPLKDAPTLDDPGFDTDTWDALLSPKDQGVTSTDPAVGGTPDSNPAVAEPSVPGPEGATSPDLLADVKSGARPGTGLGESIENGLGTAGKFSKGFNLANKYVMNPLGIVSNGLSFYEDAKAGNKADAFADAAGFTGSSLSTALGFGANLGPAAPWIAAGAGGFAGGYAIGQLLLAAGYNPQSPNNYNNALKPGTEMATADPDELAERRDRAWNGDVEEVRHIDIGAPMDQTDAQETQSELEDSMKFSSSAREEMPPLPTEEQKH